MMCNLVQGTQSFSSAIIQLFQLVLLKPHLNLNSVKIRNDKIEFFEKQTFSINMSTTRSQKRKNTQREAEDNVSEGFISNKYRELSFFEPGYRRGRPVETKIS